MTNTTRPTRLCIGGSLHGQSLPSGDGGAQTSVPAEDSRDPQQKDTYRSATLEPEKPQGTSPRDFFVFDGRWNKRGKRVKKGWTDAKARQTSYDEAVTFWKADPETDEDLAAR